MGFRARLRLDSDDVVYYAGALGALAGVALGVVARLEGNVFLWASIGAVIGLVIGLLLEDYSGGSPFDEL